MNFKFVISFVILAGIALVRANSDQANNEVLQRFQNNPNRPLTISEMIAIVNNNLDGTESKFDAKRIFQVPTMCAEGERLDNKGRCRKYMD